MSAKAHIRSLSLAALESIVTGSGEPAFRYRQLAEWLYRKLETRFDAMSNLPQSMRERLASAYEIESFTGSRYQESADDGTRKYLFDLGDGAQVESVMMRYDRRTTLCVSSQVGCPLDCVFCETAKGRFQRNLTAGEILDQICALKAAAGAHDNKINVVFMGMGEPLLNLDAVIQSIGVMNDPLGLDMGAKRITVSTSSFPDRVRELADADVSCSLALSLNAPNDAERSQLMPKAARFPIAELLDAARYFVRKRSRRATLEYVMLGGVNTSDRHARELGELVRETPFKLNLIPYNPGRDPAYETLSEADLQRFVRLLLPNAPTVTVRRSRGVDIDAACGQLWTQSLREKKVP